MPQEIPELLAVKHMSASRRQDTRTAKPHATRAPWVSQDCPWQLALHYHVDGTRLTGPDIAGMAVGDRDRGADPMVCKAV